LVRRGEARSRVHAAQLIAQGRVSIDGVTVAKPAAQISPAQALAVAPPPSGQPDYASRGGHKLAGALDELARLGLPGPQIEGVRALDAGASTGGFTDVLLQRGAAHVTAVDVGYGQLAWRLQCDDRVTVMDRTNVRYLQAGDVDPPPGLVVADLSFISLTTVLSALVAVARADAQFLLMVKPQFEVGKDALPPGGVVRDVEQRAAAVARVVEAAQAGGLELHGVVPSPLPGPSGNVEFFIYLSHDAAGALRDEKVRDAIVGATQAGGGT
jgi:23S rRNA (cytidine1920-2'-O)/16S rRNA (cytidine1409-2'-O)-methyltransferase